MKILRNKDLEFKTPIQKDGTEYPYGASAKLFITKQIFLFKEKLAAGKDASAPHYHQFLDEVITVIKGELYVIEGDEESILNEGDSVLFKADSKKKHYLRNRSDSEAEFLVFRQNISESDVVY